MKKLRLSEIITQLKYSTKIKFYNETKYGIY